MKVHLINGNPQALSAIEKSLQESNITLSVSDNYETISDDIKENSPSIVIFNWIKADYDIIAACRGIRRLKISKNMYIIVLLAREKEEELKKILSAGVDDFVFKPFGRNELSLRIEVAKKYIKLDETLNRNKKKLLKLAKEDPLTNVLNSRAILDESLKEMGRAAREEKHITALMTQIINFRDIVDSHGAMMGNAVLVEYSRRIMSVCRPYDKVGRHGIFDFIVVLPDALGTDAEKIAQRIIASVSEKPFKIHGIDVTVELAAGISEIKPTEIAREKDAGGMTRNDQLLDALIKRAEMALEKAAEKKYNRIETYMV